MTDKRGRAIVRAMEENATLRKQIRDLEAALIYLYNKGYHAGHHDTVEACYTDIMDCDMGEYHADEVNDICAALHRDQEGGVHSSPADCPNWYDWCRCLEVDYALHREQEGGENE